MKKVLIVDDEVLVRVGIKSLISWEEHGYTIVADASNGQEALEKIVQHHPQIVLTDLRMEPGSGLWLMKECRKRMLPVSFIVLSNYNDFENVKEAMKAGAKDYVFKLTVQPQELLTILDGIECEEYGEVKVHQSEEVVRKNRDAILRSLFQKLTSSHLILPESLQKEMDSISLAIRLDQPYCVLYLKIDNLFEAKRKGNFENLELLCFALKNIAEELLSGLCRCEFFQCEVCDLAVVWNYTGDYEGFLEQMKREYQRLAEHVRKYFGIGISGALSRSRIGMETFAEAVKEDRRLLESRFFCEDSAFLPAGIPLQRAYDCMHALGRIEAAETKDGAVLTEVGRQVLEEIRAQIWNNAAEVRNLLQYLYRKLRRCCTGNDTEWFAGREKISFEEAIAEYDFFTDIRALFLDFIAYAQNAEPKSSLGKPCRTEIAEVKRYIRAHCEEDLSLPGMADLAGMSESRFSHVFKEEVGVGFAEYVVSVRMETACDLLAKTDLRVNEIAEQIGISNANYFSALFKRRTGMSPNEYRKREWSGRK